LREAEMALELIEKQVVYDGKKVRLELHHFRDEDSGKRFVREIVVHGGAVVVVPFLDRDTILLVRNNRHAVGQILLELPAGTLEKGESPMNCAGRELLEETGYLAARMKPIGSFFTSPGILSEKMHAFAAYDLTKKRQSLEEGEELEVDTCPFDAAILMIREGQIQDAKTIAALLMYERFMRAQTA
jgi:ADP-ribose pyrophosphatase